MRIIKLSTLRTAVAGLLLLACGLTSDGASAAPPGLPDRPLDVELKGTDVANVFRMLAEVSGRKVTLDSCVHGAVDLRLANAPLSLVYDALAMKLGLVYEEDGSGIVVRCAGDSGAPSAKLASRVSLAEKENPLPDVLGRLAVLARLEGVDYRASATPKVTITLEGVRVSTALAALADGTGLKMSIVRERLVVTE